MLSVNIFLSDENESHMRRRLAEWKLASPEEYFDTLLEKDRNSSRTVFHFEDISKLADVDIEAILRKTDRKKWLTALQQAKQEVLDAVLLNMSERARAVFLEDLCRFDLTNDLKIIEQTRQELAAEIGELEKLGEITLSRRQSGD